MLTTNQKITGAFIVTMCIMAILASVGYRGLVSADAGLRNNSRLAFIDVAVSDTVAALNNAAYLAVSFLRNDDKTTIERAQAAAEEAVSLIAGARKALNRKDLIDEIGVIEASLIEYHKDLQIIQELRTKSLTTYREKMLPPMLGIFKNLNQLTEQTYAIGNVEVLHEIAKVWPYFSDLETALTRFIETENPADGVLSQKDIDALGPILLSLEASLQTPAGHVVFATLNNDYQAVAAGFQEVLPFVTASRDATVERTKHILDIRQNANAFNEKFVAVRAARESEIAAASASTRSQTLTVALIGLLVSGVFALFIVLSISRTLAKLSAFSSRIASGDLQAESGVREKGAIGNMVAAMEEIPKCLNNIIEETNRAAVQVSIGYFRDRFDASAFAGGFANLGKTINTLAEAYTKVLDAIPNPIMACSLEQQIRFLNTAAEGAVGTSNIDKQCNDILGAKECGTDECLGASACRLNATYTAKTAILVNGAMLDVNVTAVPLRGADDEPIGFIEVIEDISGMTGQQKLIMQAATEASEISDRIATAAEELSAQIEHINQGTEQQKQQVESTASAMSQMNSTVLEVARNAGQASIQTDDTRQKAQSSASLVNQVVDAINQVNTVASTLQDNMKELGVQAESIGSVMSVISDIADQTNLLALNAAIEAARAGEAGRGFAVVADEVRKLAEKTMQATHEVGQSISAIQNSARVNIEEVTTAVSSISDATELANSSGQALGEIVDLASSNSTLVASIATAAEEQSATSEEINHSIEEISTVVIEITTSMEQSSQAVHELASMSQSLRSLMEELSNKKIA